MRNPVGSLKELSSYVAWLESNSLFGSTIPVLRREFNLLVGSGYARLIEAGVARYGRWTLILREV
jgi:hypothetical protein